MQNHASCLPMRWMSPIAMDHVLAPGKHAGKRSGIISERGRVDSILNFHPEALPARARVASLTPPPKEPHGSMFWIRPACKGQIYLLFLFIIYHLLFYCYCHDYYYYYYCFLFMIIAIVLLHWVPTRGICHPRGKLSASPALADLSTGGMGNICA